MLQRFALHVVSKNPCTQVSPNRGYLHNTVVMIPAIDALNNLYHGTLDPQGVVAHDVRLPGFMVSTYQATHNSLCSMDQDDAKSPNPKL